LSQENPAKSPSWKQTLQLYLSDKETGNLFTSG
jgi:hypothetical protein